jgi:hypothetical protein
MPPHEPSQNIAIMHFRRAWSRGHIQDILARLTGRSNDLLAYDDIRRKLKGSASRKRELKDIPLAAIVGSVGRIRERGMLRGFAGRTETDLYIWISRHRARLVSQLGWSIDPEVAADDLAETQGKLPGQLAGHMGKRILAMVRPEAFDDGPAPGQWRRDRHIASLDHRLSADVLVCR